MLPLSTYIYAVLLFDQVVFASMPFQIAFFLDLFQSILCGVSCLHFWFDGQLHSSRVAMNFWRPWRNMDFAPRPGHGILQERSLYGLWWRKGRYWLRQHSCMDLKMNDKLWDCCRSGKTARIIFMENYMATDNETNSISCYSVSSVNKCNKGHYV